MYYFVKMSSGWYGTRIGLIDGEDKQDIYSHINQGEIVAFADEVETFADEMGIEVDDIEMVE